MALVATCLCACAAATAVAVLDWLDSPVATTNPGGQRTVNSENLWAFDVTDKRQVVSWADDVFVGRVIGTSDSGIAPVARYLGESKEGAPYVANYEEGSPYTLYDVEVVRSLKGPLSGTVQVAQEGGYKDGALYTSEHDALLVTGRTYIFATRGPLAKDDPLRDDPLVVAPDAAWVLSKYGDIPVDTSAKSQKLVEEYRAALGGMTED